jgi:DNA/RNA non-specific endonuclease
LIGDRLGGFGERVNLVGRLRGNNRGEYRALEEQFAELAAQGNVVQVTVQPQYNGSNPRRDFIFVESTVNGGPSNRPTPFDSRP